MTSMMMLTGLDASDPSGIALAAPVYTPTLDHSSSTMPEPSRKKRKQSRPASLPIAPASYAPPTPPRDDDLQTPVIKPLASPLPFMTPSLSSSSPAAVMAASTRRHSYPIPQPAAAPSSLHDIENEMAYTKDSLATLAVMYDSLRQAYDHGKPQLRYHPTRLDAMEKELLSAYDDLELQVIHMKKQIAKLESSWFAWKSHQTPPS